MAYELRICDWSSDVCYSDLDITVIKHGCHAVINRYRHFKHLAPGLGYRIEPQHLRRRHFVTIRGHGVAAKQVDLPTRDRSHAGQPALAHRYRRQLGPVRGTRSEEHTSELQSLMRISYAVFCLKKKKKDYIRNLLQHNYKKLKLDIIYYRYY